VFARQLEGLAREGDIFIAMSTSGSSKNIVQALQTAQKIGMRTMLLTGEKARNLPPLAEHIIIVPSLVTAHIQEAHLFLLHAMAGMVEKELNYAV
jgi:D-sedoheptulose 7-phosphate isomerase